jgi:hypothetical protein
MTSSMLERVSRAITPDATIASVTAGSNRWWSRSRIPLEPVGLRMPEEGNQPSWTAKTTTSSIASQKVGIDSPTRAPVVSSRSGQRWRQTAATIPAVVPNTMQRTSAAPARTSVAPKRPRTSPATGRSREYDRPRSPVSARPTQPTYCCGSGRSSWSSLRRLCRLAGVA